MKNSKAFWKS